MNFKLLRITTVPISLKTLLKGQHRYMIRNGINVIGVSSPGTELQDVRESEDITVSALKMTRTISPFKDLRSLWSFYRLCKKEKPHIVHSHTPKAGIIGMLGAWLAGVPIRMHTVAGLPLMEASGFKRTLLDFVEKVTYRCASKVYPNSKGLYDFILEQHFTSKEKLKVIGNGSSNGIDTTHFSLNQISEQSRAALRTSLGINTEDFIFIFVGRMVGDKGLNELITAFRQISAVDDAFQDTPHLNGIIRSPKLLLVGSFEPELDPLRTDTLQEIETNPNIISVGYQQDVRPYFAVSDCLVFPSYREGFPNVVMQAGAMGLPSIVSDINGCNEIIIEGQNGTVIPAKNTAKLASAMQKMLIDQDFYDKVKDNARDLISSRYEQQVVWDALLAEYRMLLDQAGRSGK